VHDDEEDEADTVDGLAATEGNGVANSWRLASGNAMPLLLLLLLLLEKATLPSPWTAECQPNILPPFASISNKKTGEATGGNNSAPPLQVFPPRRLQVATALRADPFQNRLQLSIDLVINVIDAFTLRTPLDAVYLFTSSLDDGSVGGGGSGRRRDRSPAFGGCCVLLFRSVGVSRCTSGRNSIQIIRPASNSNNGNGGPRSSTLQWH
jgi:hypothetical protein